MPAGQLVNKTGIGHGRMLLESHNAWLHWCVWLQAELEQLHQEYAAIRVRYEQGEQQRATLKLALADAQAAAADAGVEVRAATAKADRLQQELTLTRCATHTVQPCQRSASSCKLTCMVCLWP